MSKLRSKWITSESAADEYVLTADGSGGAAWESPGHRDTWRWAALGKYTAVDNVDGRWVAPADGTILRVTAHRRTAGISGTTEVDLRKNGVSVYPTTTPPQIQSSDGNDFTVAVIPDVTTFVQDDYFDIDILTVEAGNIADLILTVHVKYD